VCSNLVYSTDVDVLRNLELSLSTFAGSAIVISHDRYFLDRICTHILAFEGDSNVVFFPGNYSEYEEDRLRRLGSKFDPKQIKFKKIQAIK
jgi:sulfate-transporting ATPase